MKKMRKNSGFTLVECVVAMAVLAIMTLGLLMILSATVRQRNLNTNIERDVDSQVENVINGNRTATTDIPDGDIVFDDFSLSGAQMVYCDDDDSDVRIGQLQYNVGEIVTAEPSEEPKKDEEEEGKKVVITESRKVYGVASLKTVADAQVTVSVPNGTTTGPVNGYYTVTWKITFEAEAVKSYGNPSTMGVESVKIAFPENVTITKYWTTNSGACPYIHRLGERTIRMEPRQADSSIDVYVTFEIKEDDYKSYINSSNESKFIEDHFGDTSLQMESK